MIRLLIACILAWFWTAPIMAAPLVADISSHKIEIHSGFTGTQLLLFGARNDPGDIVVVVRGPEVDYVVRKKERVAGIWVNSQEAAYENVPQFYGIASNRPLEGVRQDDLFGGLELYDPSVWPEDEFYSALKRILQEDDLYQGQTGIVEFMGETLFKATFNFPDNMPRGTYTAEAYLFSDGLLSGVQSTPIEVYKTGFDAFLYDSAHNHSLIYGLAAVLIATALGWGANWLFKRI